jgi:hypothetical protein
VGPILPIQDRQMRALVMAGRFGQLAKDVSRSRFCAAP